MIAGLIALLVTFTIPLLIIRWFVTRRSSRKDFGDEVREIFQYLSTLILLVVVNTGLAGIINNLLPSADRILTDENLLARNTAFIVVGAPLLWLVSRWDRKSLSEVREENDGFALQLYFLIAPIAALLVISLNFYEFVTTSIRDESFDGQGLVTSVIWAITLALHFRWANRFLTKERVQPSFLLASAISLVLLVVGAARVLRSLFATVLPYSESTLVTTGPSELVRGLTLIGIALAFWVPYWIFNQSRAEQTSLWNGYLLLIGIFAPLAAMIVSSSVMVYQSLVWYLGDPVDKDLWTHLDQIPTALGTLIAGAFSFAYHQLTLQTQHQNKRSEVSRIYEYLLSAGGLITSAVAIMISIVAIIESFTTEIQLFGQSATNKLLLAFTLLVAGLPLWQVMWRRISQHVAKSPGVELRSTTRRIYLIVILGVSGIAAIASLLTMMVRLFEGIFNSDLGTATLRDSAYPIGIVVAATAGAIYHLLIFRNDRSSAPQLEQAHRYLLLIGPEDASFKREIEHFTGAKVEVIALADGYQGAWSVDEVKRLLAANHNPELAVIHDSKGYQLLPIKR